MPTNPNDSANAPQPQPVPPDLLAWARQTFDLEDFMKDVREIEATGGLTYESMIEAIEAKVRGE